jgi:tryptophan synthase alpha chain
VLEEYIRQRRQHRKILLMTHAVVGYPSLENNWDMLVCMQAAGIDLVELQLPFSEPIADGPAFIHANQSALEQGIHWQEYFDFFRKAADEFDFPLLFMGYYNSIFCMGHEAFSVRLKSARGSGFIVADLPIELSVDLDLAAKAQGLEHIQIMTPVNSKTRLQQIAEKASGFLYCVARKGVTGRETAFDQELADYMQRCRAVSGLPLALGFGIKTPLQISKLQGLADVAIIGSACLEVWETETRDNFQKFLNDLLSSCN